MRFKSHAHLPEKERHVEIERYRSVLPETFLNRKGITKRDESTDQYLDMLSEKKENLNNQFLSVLKKVGS